MIVLSLSPLHCRALALSIDTAKLVNIFHTTKYFDKIFQNIFILFIRGISVTRCQARCALFLPYFFLVRKKIFPALGGYFFSFCERLAWRGTRGIWKIKNQKWRERKI